MERTLQTTSLVDRQLLTMDEHEYKEFEAIFNDLLTDPKLLENSKELEPDKDGNPIYMRLVNVRSLDEYLYIIFSVQDSIIRVTNIIHKETVDKYRKTSRRSKYNHIKNEKTSKN